MIKPIHSKSFPSSGKEYVRGSLYPELRVPMRKIRLEEPNPSLYVYDTSGPYTDPEVRIDFKEGLAPTRLPWIKRRGDTEGSRFLKAKPGRNV